MIKPIKTSRQLSNLYASLLIEKRPQENLEDLVVGMLETTKLPNPSHPLTAKERHNAITNAITRYVRDIINRKETQQ